MKSLDKALRRKSSLKGGSGSLGSFISILTDIDI